MYMYMIVFTYLLQFRVRKLLKPVDGKIKIVKQHDFALVGFIKTSVDKLLLIVTRQCKKNNFRSF